MEKYKKILAIFDPTTEDQKAFERAIQLATKTKATLPAQTIRKATAEQVVAESRYR